MAVTVQAMQKPSESITMRTGMKGNPLAAPQQAAPVAAAPLIPPQGQQQAVQTPNENQNMQHMAKREQMIREQQRTWTQERDELKAKLAKFETEYIPREALLKDTYKTLTENGIDYSKITQEALTHLNEQDPVSQHIKSLEDKIQALESGFTETKSAIDKAQEQAYSDALRQIDADAQAVVKSRPDDFEFLATSNSAARIHKFIESVFQKGLPGAGDVPAIKPNTVLAVEDAAKMLEDFQLEEFKKLGQTKKGQALMRTLLFGDEKNQQAVQSKESPVATTITNSMAAAAKPLSPRDRAIRAIEEMKRAKHA